MMNLYDLFFAMHILLRKLVTLPEMLFHLKKNEERMTLRSLFEFILYFILKLCDDTGNAEVGYSGMRT